MFKKLLAVAAVVATAACLSVSAFAAGETAALTQAKDGVTVSGYEAVQGATQYTVMVFKCADNTTDFAAASPASVADIYYINQGEKLYAANDGDTPGLLDQMLVKLDEGKTGLADGDYVVRIGNNATGGTPVSLGLKVTTEVAVLYGDVNDDSVINTKDAVLTLRASLSAVTLTADQQKAADVDGVSGLTTKDAVYILRKGLGAIDKFPVEE